ncbi:MAG: hypothetical protein M1838_001323 [Thelocarpon superellum]|nr:MAG: hypothetical protein M1838_001323 [Thelocarpon superellum]
MTTRTRGPLSSPTKTLKQKQLEKLRRRHGGEKHLVDSDSSSPEATKRSAGGLYDNDSDRDDDGNEMDLTWVEDDETKISATEEIRQILRDGHSDEYEEDFVDDEGDDTLGAPLDEHSALQGIPLEFTRHSHKKPKEHFQDAVKWMVHNKLDPAFPRDDAIYQVAFQKLDDEVQGRSRSTFISAAWTADFVRALRSRPDIVTDEGHSGLVLEHCEACNRVGHPATWTIHLTGKPYHRHTLEDVTDDEEDGNGDDDDDVDDVDDDADDAEEPSEHGSVDSKGNPLPSQHKAWCVGRHCGANAEMAHRLMHWRYASNHMVLTYLDKEGHMEAEQVIRRARWSNNKRSKFADIVLDEMVESGQVEMLYQDFKSTLHEARSSKPSRFSVR